MIFDMDIKEMDIDAVAKAIVVDVGESLPCLRQALKEAEAGMAGRVTTPEQTSCAKHAKNPD